jgi:putative transposase
VAEPVGQSFGFRVRDEVLSVEAFDSVLKAQMVIDDWRKFYNHKRPHSSLGWKPSAAYAATLIQLTRKERSPTLTTAGPTNGGRSARRDLGRHDRIY